MLDIKDMVCNGKMVKFDRYTHGELWYITEDGFEFPVPIDDTGDGVFARDDRALYFMRYIRKHMATIKQGRAECATTDGLI